MANTFKLSALREKSQESFADLEIEVSEDETITLLNVLRLSDDQRDEIDEYFKALGSDEEIEAALTEAESESEDAESEDAESEDAKAEPTMFDVIGSIIRRVATEREIGDRLVDDLIRDDKALMLTIFNQWSEKTQVGEA